MKKKWRSNIGERLFESTSLAAVILPLMVLALLLISVCIHGLSRLNWQFLSSFPSRLASLSGILPSMVGSFYLILLTTTIAVPIGIGASIYLEEYRTDGWLSRLIEANVANLAGVPSVIYGMLGLGIFVRVAAMGNSLIAGACTLTLLILPIIITASREALRTVPVHLKEASYGLGGTKWSTIRTVTLPLALPGMLTGAILALSRAIGETAPLVVVGGVTYISFLPDSVYSPYSALPLQIFNWVSRPQEAFVYNAAAGIIVLLIMMLSINTVALLLRAKLQRRIR